MQGDLKRFGTKMLGILKVLQKKNGTRVESKGARFYAAHLVKWLLGEKKGQNKNKSHLQIPHL